MDFIVLVVMLALGSTQSVTCQEEGLSANTSTSSPLAGSPEFAGTSPSPSASLAPSPSPAVQAAEGWRLGRATYCELQCLLQLTWTVGHCACALVHDGSWLSGW